MNQVIVAIMLLYIPLMCNGKSTETNKKQITKKTVNLLKKQIEINKELLKKITPTKG